MFNPVSSPSVFGSNQRISSTPISKPARLESQTDQKTPVQAQKTVIEQNERHLLEFYSPFPRELRDIITSYNLCKLFHLAYNNV
jgi:hypothetical protein